MKAIKMAHPLLCFVEKRIKLEVHVVEIDKPLLLSLKKMKTMGLVLTDKLDKVFLDGEGFDLETTSTGHYTLTLAKTRQYPRSPTQYANQFVNQYANQYAKWFAYWFGNPRTSPE